MTFQLSRIIVFWHSKSYFDIRPRSENRILTFESLFAHSNWVGKGYFDIQNPISTFELNRRMSISYSKSYFLHSKWVGKCYFEIENRILTFELSRKMLFWQKLSCFDIRTESENAILIFKILFWHSNWVGK